MQHLRTIALVALLFALVAPRAIAAPRGQIDDPYLEKQLERPAPVLVRPRAPRWGDHAESQLAIAAGWTSVTGLSQLSAPSVEASLTLRFRGVSERLGLRLSGFFAIESFGSTDEPSLDTEGEPAPRAMGLGLAVEISWPGGFYLAPGLGVYHQRHQVDRWFAVSSADSPLDSLTVPELTLAVGWQWNLSRHFALQLAAQAGTALVTLRGSVSAGLVWRL